MSDSNSSNKIEILNRQSLAFSGIITASLSHELNNAFAIINEYNGLLDDMLMGFKQGVPLDEKKILRSSQKIGFQIERGKELIKRLNKFAHSTDYPVAEVDIAQIVQAIVDLSQRLAGLKEMIIEFKKPSAESIVLNTNPFYLQQAIFACFQIFIANTGANRSITIAVDKAEQEILIKITGTAIGDDDFTRERIDLLKILLEQLNGDLDISSGGDQDRSIVLALRELKAEV